MLATASGAVQLWINAHDGFGHGETASLRQHADGQPKPTCFLAIGITGVCGSIKIEASQSFTLLSSPDAGLVSPTEKIELSKRPQLEGQCLYFRRHYHGLSDRPAADEILSVG